MDKKKRHEELILEAKRFFNSYKKNIAESIRSGEKVVRLSFLSLAQFSPQLTENLIESPEETVSLLEIALDESELVKNARIRFTELPRTIQTKIREIRAMHIDQLVWVEGIVRQASDVRPQVVNAKFECPNCGAILS